MYDCRFDVWWILASGPLDFSDWILSPLSLLRPFLSNWTEIFRAPIKRLYFFPIPTAPTERTERDLTLFGPRGRAGNPRQRRGSVGGTRCDKTHRDPNWLTLRGRRLDGLDVKVLPGGTGISSPVSPLFRPFRQFRVSCFFSPPLSFEDFRSSDRSLKVLLTGAAM